MEMHKNKENVSLETNDTPSLRRKSILLQNASSSTLTENNDEAERLALRHEINASALTKTMNASNKRRSLGLGFLSQMPSLEIKNHISDCIKLNTENKINVKNAFSLEIIDFMTYMISKRDANISNLQVASTSLDVSAKIYSFRVDSIHTEIMKMSGGLDKHEKDSSINHTETHMNDGQENQENNVHKMNKKKKKRSKHKIFGMVDSLRGSVEIMKPSLWIREDQDVQTTDALYQVMLPNHANSEFYLHLYNDVIFDTINCKINNESKKVAIPGIEDISKWEMCPPLTNFEFHNWVNDNEIEENNSPLLEESNENKFEFDLNASLPSEDEVHDMNYLDIQDEEEENVEKCVDVQKSKTKILDLYKVVANQGVAKTSEYSFLQKNMNIHWAGPSHWKITSFRNFSGRHKIVETCHQERTKKKKTIEINYDCNSKETIERKFILCRPSGKSEVFRTDWLESKFTLPRDMHYNIASATKLYLHKLINISVEERNELNATHVSDIEDYNYDNENDTSDYCPCVPNEDYEDEDNINANECDFKNELQPAMQVFTEDNLVAPPKLTNKVIIAYSTQAKRIDMRQLKKSIWKGLTLKTNSSVIQDIDVQNTVQQEENKINEKKCFSQIYKILPNILTKTNIEALSFPISFVSLLHLANEKTLKIQSLPDMSDIIIDAN